ncbi:MAG: hypothetical protein FWD69_14925 [Polyangiaceae bacterium]|nr:hypothetical protein [Polyangiaceae bacterium]
MSSPSLKHESFLLLFRNRPELAPELLRDVFDVPLPAYAEAKIESADLTQVAPTEYRADLVVLLVDGKPVLGIVVEVQLRKDDGKKYSWPVYVSALRARLKCPTCVMVVTSNESVATWARTPIDLGPGGQLRPLVISPSAVPVVRDIKLATSDPELAVLSAMAHGNGAPEIAVEVAKVALAATKGLDDERVMLYSDLILHSLSNGPARIALEELMASGTYEYQSDFARKYVAKGKVEGRAEGKVEGRAEGKAEDVLMVLEARHRTVTEEQKQRILSCTDLDVLDRWLRKAVVLTSVDELFS